MRHVVSALVHNVPGVLSHISGMLASRGYNIDSLAGGETEDPKLSRMTFVVVGSFPKGARDLANRTGPRSLDEEAKRMLPFRLRHDARQRDLQHGPRRRGGRGLTGRGQSDHEYDQEEERDAEGDQGAQDTGDDGREESHGLDG